MVKSTWMSCGRYLRCPPPVRTGWRNSANSLSQYLSVWTSTPVMVEAVLMLTASGCRFFRRLLGIVLPRFSLSLCLLGLSERAGRFAGFELESRFGGQ